MRRSMRCAAVLVSGLLFVGSVGEAQAQPKPPAGQPAKKPLTDKQKKEEAGKAYKEAQEKFSKGDYAGAVVLYEKADELFPGSKPKFQAAVSYDKMGKVKEAVAAYDKFLASNPEPDKFKNNEIADAKTRVEALKKTPAKVKVATEPAGVAGLKLAVDGAAQPGPELSVPPGKHKITASAEGYETATQEVDVTFGEAKDIKLTLNKAAGAPPPVAAVTPPPATKETPPATKPEPEKPAEPRSNVPAYVTLGLAGVGVVVGTIFGISALSAKSDFDAEPTTENADKTDRNALIADMSFAVALTFGVTGTVLLLSSGKSDDKPAASARRGFVAPYVAPKGGGAAAMFTF